MVTVNAHPDVLKLMKALKTIGNREVRGWMATRASSGSWTITTPRRGLRLVGPDSAWTGEQARAHMGKLRQNGFAFDDDQPVKAVPRHARPQAYEETVETATEPAEAAQHEAPEAPAAAPEAPAAPPEAAPGTPVRIPPAIATTSTGWPHITPDMGEVQYELDITPVMAQELLDRPFEATTSDGRVLRQRRRVAGNTRSFEELIYANKFKLTHQGVAIGINGSLYDGQHRLAACVATGKTLRMRVTFNVHPDNIEAFDAGAGRGISTKLAMLNIKHANSTGAAARLVKTYIDWEEACALGEEGKSLMRPWRTWYGISNKMLYMHVQATVNEHPDLLDAVDWAVTTGKRGKGFVASNVAAFKYLALRAWPEAKDQLDTFLNAVVSGIGIDSHEHIAVPLREYADNANNGKVRARFFSEEQLHVLIKGWNTYTNGKTIKQIKPGSLPTEFPLLYTPSKTRRKG